MHRWAPDWVTHFSLLCSRGWMLPNIEKTPANKNMDTHTRTQEDWKQKSNVWTCVSLSFLHLGASKGTWGESEHCCCSVVCYCFLHQLILSERPQTLAGQSWIMLSYNSKSNTVVLLTCDWKQWFLPLLYSVFWAIVLFGMCSVHGAICSIWTVWALRYIIQYLMSEL